MTSPRKSTLQGQLLTTRDLGKWELRFLEAAELVASWSPDPSSQVGAVAISQDYQPISWGWNAFPRKCMLIEGRVSKEIKYKYIVHAEMNAIYNASRESACLRDSIFFIYGMPPCVDCAKGLIQAGVQSVLSVVYSKAPETDWWNSHLDGARLFNQSGVKSEVILMAP